MSECVGSALIQKGFKAAPDQFIGIFAQNRPEVLTTRHPIACGVDSSQMEEPVGSSHLPLLGTRFCALIITEKMSLCYFLESDTIII